MSFRMNSLTHPMNELSNLLFLIADFYDTVVPTKEIRLHLCGQGVPHGLPSFCYFNTSMWSTWAHMWEKCLSCYQTWKLKHDIIFVKNHTPQLWPLLIVVSTINCMHPVRLCTLSCGKKIECLSISGFHQLCQHIIMCLATHMWHIAWRLIFLTLGRWASINQWTSSNIWTWVVRG